MSRYRLTKAADQDIETILRETTGTFGTQQRRRYAEIIRLGIEMVAAEPARPGSKPRPEIHAGIRSFHLDLAAGRVGGASHHLYYITHQFADGGDGVILLRILHERMDPGRHLADRSC